MIPPDLHSQMLRMLDGELSSGELEALEAELEVNPEARKLWQKLSRLHSALEVHHASQANIAQFPVVPVDLVLARQRRRVVKASLMAAAALILISTVVLWRVMAPAAPSTFADFHAATKSVFTLTHVGEGEPPMGSGLAEGSRLVLDHGAVELDFPNQVRGLVEAPASFEMVDERTLRLDHGRVFFHVGSEAGRGFTVITPHQRIVDLGTRFGIDARRGHDEVELHVFEGSVRVDDLDENHGEIFKAGRSVLLAGRQVKREMDGPPATFRRQLPTKVETLLHVDFESGLLAGRDYAIRMDPTAIRDLSGNRFPGIDDDTTWNFTTAPVTTALIATDLNEGGTDTGFDGGFHAGSKHVFVIDAPDLTYPKYGIGQTGDLQRVYSANAWSDRQDQRDLATTMTGEIWFTALVNVPAGSEYAGLTFSNSDRASYDPLLTEVRILMTPDQLQVAFGKGVASPGMGSFSAGSTHLLLGRMKVGVGDDALSVWVDPDLSSSTGPASLPSPNFTSTTVDFTDTVTHLGVAGRAGSGPDVFIDAIRLSNTETAFADVTGAPAGGRPRKEGPPTILRLNPPVGSVRSDRELLVTFSKAVQRGEGDIVIRAHAGGEIIETIPMDSERIRIRHSEMMIDPASSLLVEASVEIPSGAILDLEGNSFAGTVEGERWTFSPETPTPDASPSLKGDDSPPMLVGTQPDDNAMHVLPGTLLRMTFDQPIQLGTGRFFIRNASDWVESELVVGGPRFSVEGRTLTVNPPAALVDGSISMGWVGNWGSDQAAGLLNPRGDGRWYVDERLDDKGSGRGIIGAMRGPTMATFHRSRAHTRIRHELGPLAANSRYAVSTAIGVRDAKATENAAFLGYTIRLISGDTVLAEISDDTPPGPPNSVTKLGFSWDSSTLPEDVAEGAPLAIEILPNMASGLEFGYLDLDNVRVTVVGE